MAETSFITAARVDPRDVISVEIGDTKQPATFYPQAKLMRWDNEVNFSARLALADEVAAESVFSAVGDAVAWESGNVRANWYPLPVSEDHPEGGYEFEITLLQQPKSNVIPFTLRTKGLEFLYQAPLAEVEKDGSTWEPNGWGGTRRRPANVSGSYAVYYADCPPNLSGGKLYRTGKAFHIYRPKVVDAAGREAWGVLHIDPEQEVMTVTLPEEFLQNAIYPIRHAAGLTFGWTSAGGSTDDPWANFIYMKAITTPASGGTLDSISMYSSVRVGSVRHNAAIYADNGGSPNDGARLAALNGTEGTLVGSSAGWVTSALSCSITQGAQYWLGTGQGCDGSNLDLWWYYDSGDVLYYEGGANDHNWPAYAGDIATVNGPVSEKVSIYATYTESGGGGNTYNESVALSAGSTVGSQNVGIQYTESVSIGASGTVVPAGTVASVGIEQSAYRWRTDGARSYSKASFGSNENPVREGGWWINGGAEGEDWYDCQIYNGILCGTQPGSTTEYDDSTSLLRGAWGPDQYLEATLYLSGTITHTAEVEFRLRSTISAGVNSGYEVLFSVNPNHHYCQIVRWNGPLGDFDYLDSYDMTPLVNGDVLGARMVGNTITVTINGVDVKSCTDNTYTTGQPGVGFWNRSGSPSDNYRYGFSDLEITDGTSMMAWSAAENAAITSAVGTRRLVMQLNATGDPASEQYRLEYRVNSGSYNPVLASGGSEKVLLKASSYIMASGAPSGPELTPPTGKTGNFTPGRVQDDENPADAVDIQSGYYTELEWCIEAVSGVAVGGDVFQFRLTKNGTVITTYTVTPQWTITSSTTHNESVTLQAVGSVPDRASLSISALMGLSAGAVSGPGSPGMAIPGLVKLSSAGTQAGSAVLAIPQSLLVSGQATQSFLSVMNALGRVVLSAPVSIYAGGNLLGVTLSVMSAYTTIAWQSVGVQYAGSVLLTAGSAYTSLLTSFSVGAVLQLTQEARTALASVAQIRPILSLNALSELGLVLFRSGLIQLLFSGSAALSPALMGSSYIEMVHLDGVNNIALAAVYRLNPQLVFSVTGDVPLITQAVLRPMQSLSATATVEESASKISTILMTLAAASMTTASWSRELLDQVVQSASAQMPTTLILMGNPSVVLEALGRVLDASTAHMLSSLGLSARVTIVEMATGGSEITYAVLVQLCHESASVSQMKNERGLVSGG